MSFENTRFVTIGASGGIRSAIFAEGEEPWSASDLAGPVSRQVRPGREELGAQTKALDASKADELEQRVSWKNRTPGAAASRRVA